MLGDFERKYTNFLLFLFENARTKLECGMGFSFLYPVLFLSSLSISKEYFRLDSFIQMVARVTQKLWFKYYCYFNDPL